MRNLKYTILVIILSILMVACSKVNQSNFDRVQPGMSMEQVTQILGEPTSTDSVNIAGISGTSATWQTKNREVNIQFLTA